MSRRRGHHKRNRPSQTVEILAGREQQTLRQAPPLELRSWARWLCSMAAVVPGDRWLSHLPPRTADRIVTVTGLLLAFAALPPLLYLPRPHAAIRLALLVAMLLWYLPLFAKYVVFRLDALELGRRRLRAKQEARGGLRR